MEQATYLIEFSLISTSGNRSFIHKSAWAVPASV